MKEQSQKQERDQSFTVIRYDPKKATYLIYLPLSEIENFLTQNKCQGP